MSDPQKVYKLALYGFSGAGKTCMLAALRMLKATENPKGYDCQYVKPMEAGADTPLRQGKKMLDEAMARIRAPLNPLVPDPTAPRPDDYPEFEFVFVDPRYKTFTARFFDYAGELVDPDRDADALAENLYKTLSQMDGIIIIAEAPRSNSLDERRALSDRVRKLREAFTVLRIRLGKGARISTPVAVVRNKWDRVLQWKGQAGEEDERELLKPYERLDRVVQLIL
jgi:hypothetical protein